MTWVHSWKTEVCGRDCYSKNSDASVIFQSQLLHRRLVVFYAETLVSSPKIWAWTGASVVAVGFFLNKK